MPYSTKKKRNEYECREIEKFSLSLPVFLHKALLQKLNDEGVGRSMSAFFIDAAASYCDLESEIAERRAVKSIKCLLVSPDGDTFEIDNLKAFCRERAAVLFPNHTPETAYEGLKKARSRNGTWFGWRFKNAKEPPVE